MLTIIAEIRIQSGGQHRQNVLGAFQKIIPTVLAEEGCHGYEPLIDHKSNASFQTQEPDTIVMLEKWESVAHLEAHLATPHMQAHHKAVKDDVVDVKIRILESGA